MKTRRNTATRTAFAIEPLSPRTLLSGEIDTAFGTNGVATTDFDAYSEQFTQVTTGAQGRIYAAGFLDGNYLIARFTGAGRLDTTFNGTGYVKVPLATGYAAGGLAVTPAGEIFVGGNVYAGPGSTLACVVNLTADGQLDTTFDGDGIWTGSWAGQSQNRLVGLAYQQNRLFAGGSDGTSFVVARFDDAGFDATFDGDGRAFYTPGGTGVSAAGFTLEYSTFGGGPLYVAGRAGGSATVVRFNADGTRDTGFAVTPISPAAGTFDVTHVIADFIGRAYVGGSVGGRATVARLTNTGVLDTSFGVGGYFTDADPGRSTVTSMNQSTGSGFPNAILLTVPNGQTGVAAADEAVSLTDAGERNLNFGTGGVITLPGQVAAESDAGGIVLAGRVLLAGDQVDTQLIRLKALPMPKRITGTLYDDVNADGQLNDTGGRTTFYGISAYLDLDDSGSRDATEPAADAGTGRFIFPNVAPGTYTVRLDIPDSAHAVQTRPAPGDGIPVTTTATNTNAGPFAVHFLPASYAVSGYVYTDANGNGVQDPGEVGVAGRRVYDDANRNQAFDADETSVFSDDTGLFTITLPGGDRVLRQVVPADAFETAHTLAVATNNASFAADSVLRVPFDTSTASPNVRFGSRPLRVVEVFAFVDTDGDGTRDDDEPAATAGGFIYADRNNDGVYDAGTDARATDLGDGRGELRLGPGYTALRQSLDPGYVRTNGDYGIAVGVGDTPVVVPPFGRKRAGTFMVSGQVFVDTNGNQYPDGDEGAAGELAGWVVYVDTNGNGAYDPADQYSATTAAGPGNPYTIALPADGRTYRFFLRNEKAPRQPVTAPAYYDFSSTTPGEHYGNRSFAIAAPTYDYPTLALGGAVYFDANKNYKRDGDPGLGGVTVYVDLDNDRVKDDNEPTAVSLANGNYAFAGLRATGGSAVVRVVRPAGYRQLYPNADGGYSVTLTADAKITARDFGFVADATPPATGSLGGFAFDDANKNGVYDGGELKTGGKTVFLDLDADGLLDSGEKSVKTGTDGAWTFTGLAAGTYHVRRVFPSGYSLSTPPIDVTLIAGQTVGNLSIGSKTGTSTPVNTASISGFAFDDKNKNGVYDAGDVFAAGKTIFLDLDDDGVKDTNEASVVTGSDGKFAFTGLAARQYHVRRVFPTGYLQSTPARFVTLTSGQAASGVAIGSRAK